MSAKTRARDKAQFTNVDRRIAFSFGALILVLLLSVLLAGGYYYRSVMEREQDNLSTLVTRILASSVNRISFSGKYHARLLLEEIRAEQPAIRYLAVADTEGRVFAHSDPALNDTRLNQEGLRAAEAVLHGKEREIRNLVMNGEPVREITLAYRAGFGNEIAGVIQVGLSDQERDSALKRGYLLIAALVLALLVAGVAASFWIGAYFGRPVKKLARDLEATLQAIPDLLFEIDENGRYLSVLAHRQEGLLADSKERLTGRTVEEVLPQPEAQTVMNALREARREGVSHGSQIRIPVALGEAWFELSVAAKAINPGEPHRFVVLSHDITARKQSENNLRQLNETLAKEVNAQVATNMAHERLLIQQSRLAAMGEMVHNIAHQWRQPLNALALVLGNIKDAYEFNDLTGEFLNMEVADGQRLIQRMSSTIDDFRNFFRPNKEKTPFMVSAAVRDAMALVGDSFRHHDIEILLESAELPLKVYGYPNEFAQVVMNVLTNAKDAIIARGRGGKIIVRIESDARYAAVYVRDDGGGVPEEILGKVFDPYFTTKDGGTGIGLYMSKMIMEKMNGAMNICNADGGALVTIRLPLE